jgi:hypothetical protein
VNLKPEPGDERKQEVSKAAVDLALKTLDRPGTEDVGQADPKVIRFSRLILLGDELAHRSLFYTLTHADAAGLGTLPEAIQRAWEPVALAVVGELEEQERARVAAARRPPK